MQMSYVKQVPVFFLPSDWRAPIPDKLLTSFPGHVQSSAVVEQRTTSTMGMTIPVINSCTSKAVRTVIPVIDLCQDEEPTVGTKEPPKVELKLTSVMSTKEPPKVDLKLTSVMSTKEPPKVDLKLTSVMSTKEPPKVDLKLTSVMSLCPEFINTPPTPPEHDHIRASRVTPPEQSGSPTSPSSQRLPCIITSAQSLRDPQEVGLAEGSPSSQPSSSSDNMDDLPYVNVCDSSPTLNQILRSIFEPPHQEKDFQPVNVLSKDEVMAYDIIVNKRPADLFKPITHCPLCDNILHRCAKMPPPKRQLKILATHLTKRHGYNEGTNCTTCKSTFFTEFEIPCACIKCKVCSQMVGASYIGHMRKHVQIMKKKADVDPMVKNHYQCLIASNCSFKCVTETELAKHLASSHHVVTHRDDKFVILKCPLCSYKNIIPLCSYKKETVGKLLHHIKKFHFSKRQLNVLSSRYKIISGRSSIFKLDDINTDDQHEHEDKPVELTSIEDQQGDLEIDVG